MLNTWLKRYAMWFVYGAIFFFGVHRFSAYTPGLAERLASYVQYPLLRVYVYLISTVQHMTRQRATNNELRTALVSTENQLIQEQARVIALASQLAYAQDTEEVRQFAERYETEQAILAQVLVRQLNQEQQSYSIDVGSNRGVTVDMVAVYKNCLLGRVSVVYPTYAKIQLITDSGCKVAAFCGTTQAQGIHEGRNNAYESSLNFVSHLEHVTVGDLVVSSGSGLVFPRGFMLGSIKDAKVDGLYYAITVTPPLDLHTVDYVYLIKK